MNFFAFLRIKIIFMKNQPCGVKKMPILGPFYSSERPAKKGNNPMVGATVAVAVSIEEAAKAGKF